MKLTKSEKIFTVVFAIIVLLELFSNQIQELLPIHFAPKPLILLSLIVFYALHCKSLNKNTNIMMILALNFSLAGDLFLMFVTENGNMFIAGLVAFLLAHVMYILVFNRKRLNKPSIPLVLLLLLYAATILWFLKNGLGDLTIPVVIYMLIILSMVIFASLRKGNVNNFSFNLVLLGAVFFIISDSILALNKFNAPIAYSHFLIMGTYALAQYLITLGILKQNQ